MANIELSTEATQVAVDNSEVFDHTPNGSNQTDKGIDMVTEEITNESVNIEDVTRKENRTVIYHVNERPPIFLSILLGFQVIKII